MANNVLKNFLGYLKLGDEEDYEDYIEDYEEEERSRKDTIDRASRHESAERTSSQRSDSLSDRRMAKKSQTYYNQEAQDLQASRRDKSQREKNNGKVVPFRTMPTGLEVCIMKPSTFEDSQEICDMLLSGRAVVTNLEGFDPDEAQRIMDFISGAVYAINGRLHQISRYIFIFSPDTIDISGDYLDLAPDDGFGVPTLNKEF